MRTHSRLAYAAIILAVQVASAAQAASIYDAPSGQTGNQNWNGTLGLDFSVHGSISVDALGAFNASGNGITGHVFTTIFNASGVAVTPTLDFFGAANPSGSAYVFQSMAPVILTPGQYQLASWGYGDQDNNFNTYGANPGPITFTTLGGYLSAMGSRYSSPGDAGSLATLADVGATRYGAGSFSATAAGPLPPPPPAGPMGPGIYDAPAGLSGNQTWAGTLGLDFTVTQAIRISALGAFDSGGDGIAGGVKTAIFDAFGQAVTPTLDFSGQPNASGSAYVFKSLGAHITLAPGNYQLASWGYSNSDPNFNTYGSNPGPVTFDTLSGRLTAVGSRYSSPGDAGSLATLGDVGATRYGAGSFLGGAVPEPTTWALMIGGFGLAGAALRRRRSAVALGN